MEDWLQREGERGNGESAEEEEWGQAGQVCQTSTRSHICGRRSNSTGEGGGPMSGADGAVETRCVCQSKSLGGRLIHMYSLDCVQTHKQITL